MKRARNPDAVGMALLEGCVDRLSAQGLRVVLCGVGHGMFTCMKKSGLADKLGEAHLFLEQRVRQTSTLLAIRHAYDLVKAPCATCPHRQPAVRERALYYQI